jgi:hypothetical protein
VSSIPRAFWFLAGAVFGLFDVAVYVVRKVGASSRAVDIVAAVLSVGFLVCVAGFAAAHLRTRGGPTGAARRFLRASPEVRSALGGEIRIAELQTTSVGTLSAELTGERGVGEAELHVERDGAGWEVTGGTLATGDLRVALR